MWILNFRSLLISGVALFAAASAQAAGVGDLPAHDPVPLVFETNLGQLPQDVDFLARGKGFAISLSRGQATLQPVGENALLDTPLQLELLNANQGPIGAGLDQLPGRINYITGNDPAQWRIGAPLFERVRYQHVYPGVDVVYYPNKGDLEYDFIVAPGSDPNDIRLRFHGAESILVDDQGALNLAVHGGVMMQHAPISYQHINGARVPVESRYHLEPDGALRFVLGHYDPAYELVIDPVLTYASLFAGSAFDFTAGVITDLPAGGTFPLLYTCGSTEGLNITPGVDLGGSGRDIFVACINPFATGPSTLKWLTVIGGAGLDTAADIDLTSSTTTDAVVVGGTTTSTNFPMANAPDINLNDGINTTNTDGFLLSLSLDGVTLRTSSYIGGDGNDTVAAISRQTNNIFITGETNSANLPIVGTPVASNLASGATVDAYVMIVNMVSGATHNRTYSSYLGAQNARPFDIARRTADRLVVVGQTGPGLNTKLAFQSTFNNGVLPEALDGFICEFNTAPFTPSDALAYSSYLGGSGADLALGVACDSNVAYVVGRTASNDFQNAGQALNGAQDAFLARVEPPAPNAILAFATLYGGPGDDFFREIAIINNSSAFIAGATNSASGILEPTPTPTPTTFDPIQTQLNPNQQGGDDPLATDIWLARFTGIQTTPSANFSSYLGGRGADNPTGITRDALGRIYLSGLTVSDNFPASNAFSTGYIGAQEGFVAIVQDVRYTDPAGIISPCGSTWATACLSLNEALEGADNYSEIWMKAGTYNEFGTQLEPGTQVYGGFAGNETIRDKRNWVDNITKFDGQAASTILEAQTDNRLDGLWFQNANGNGGAILLDTAPRVTVQNCFFYRNNAIENGGGISIFLGSNNFRILNSVFVDNNAGDGGGAIYAQDASGLISQCTFALNTSPVGTALLVDSSVSQVSVVNSVFSGAQELIAATTFFPTVQNSVVEGGCTDCAPTNVLNETPLFVLNPVDNTDPGDVRLQPGSPGTDIGLQTNTDTLGYIFYDYDRKTRFISGTCGYDAGAFESDPLPPAITINGAEIFPHEVSTTYTDPGATAENGCGDDLTSEIVVGNLANVNIFVVGDYPVTYDVADAFGQNALQVVRTVQVVDNTLPIISRIGPAAVSVECGATYVDQGATASDNGVDDLTTDIITTNPVNTSTPGTYTVRYNVTDPSANAAVEVTRTVTVEDTQPPAILLTGGTVTIACNGSYVEPGFSASDACSGDLTGAVNDTDNIDITTPGTYTVNYQVFDDAGREATASRTVIVEDNTAPVITREGPALVTLECGAAYSDEGATAIDDCAGDLTGSIIATGISGVLTNTPGDYLISYNVQDAEGNPATTVQRTVRVQDTTAPILNLTGGTTINLECGATFTDPGATATDTCDPSPVVNVAGTVDTTTPGAYTLTYTAQDNTLNTSAPIQRTVLVDDNTNPVVNLVGDLSLTVECGSSYTDAGATATDTCDAAPVLVGPIGTVDTSTPGVYLIEYTAEDDDGNKGAAVRTVTVADGTPPLIALNGSPSFNVNCGEAYIEPGANAADNCSPSVAVDITGTVDTTTPGAYTVFYNATDDDGNNAIQQTRTVNVTDATPPVLALLGASPLVLQCGEPFTEPGYTATDDCDGDLFSAVLLAGDAINTAAPGLYTRTYEVVNAAGLSSGVVSRVVEVQDNAAPLLALNGPELITTSCGNPFTDPGVTATDACEGNLAGSVVLGGDVLNLDAPGDYLITYDVQDSEGNAAPQVARTIRVQDNASPVLTLLGSLDITLECGEDFVEPGYTAVDACEGDLASLVQVTVANDAKPLTDGLLPGSYIISYAVQDAAGNAAQQTRNLEIVDTTGPVITLAGPGVINLSCGNTYAEPGASALDACEGAVAVSISGSVNPEVEGVYQIRYSAQDSEGNQAALVFRTVNVVNDGLPVINLVGDSPLQVECGGVFSDPGATAQDDCSLDITDDIQVAGSVNTAVPGLYTRTYTVEDNDNNVATIDRAVEVVDNTPPAVALVGPALITLECGAVFTDPGATALDACEGDLTASITVRTPVKGGAFNTPGDYFFEYVVSDSAGNEGVALRQLTVQDTTDPTITLIGAATLNIACGDAFVDPGFNAFDTCGGNLNAAVVVSGDTVNPNAPGAYLIRYNVADGEGNTASQRARTVNVVDADNPVLTLVGSPAITLNCGAAYNEQGAIASDPCEGNISARIQVTGSVNVNTPGTYVVTYAVTDTSGRAATPLTRTITVRDNCAGEGEGEEEGEGAPEGEGEGAPTSCDTGCETALDVDEDGDGLTACEEAFFGTSDSNTDSDGDGIADSFEARFCPELDPADPADAGEDPDNDGFDNFEEFLRRSNPLDPASPANVVFVAPFASGGRDEPGRGSQAAPFATITFALTQVSGTPAAPVTLLLAGGIYTENIVLKPNVTLQARRGAEVVLVGTIIGAENCGLYDLTIAPRASSVALLTADNIAMRIVRCIFRGTSRRDSTGIVITGNRAREVVIEACLFERLAVGIDVDAGHPALRLSEFDNISGFGMFIRCNGDEEIAQFDPKDPRTGFNTFQPTIDGFAVFSECPGVINMERNDWGVEEPPTDESIGAVIQGNVNFDEFLAKGGALFAASLFCTVWDADDQEPILNASVTIAPASAAPVTNNENGLYPFPAVSSGNYTVNVTAPGYASLSRQVIVQEGAITSVTLPLTFTGAIEGEGEGEDPPVPGPCGCDQADKLGPPQPGQMLLSLLTFAILALSTFTMRRQSLRPT